MKKFKIDVWEEMTYTKVFQAKTKEQAEELAFVDLELNGFDNWNLGKHGDFDIVAVEEVK